MKLEKLSPIWTCRDVDAAETFYWRLGFRTIFKAPDKSYLILKRDGAELHFAQNAAHDPRTTVNAAYMRPSDVDQLSEEWAQLGLPEAGQPRFKPAVDTPWGMRELSLVDPDGNLIRAGIEIQNWSPGVGEQVPAAAGGSNA